MSNNNNFDPFQRNFNSRTSNRLNISEQLDLVYNENNNLKNYLHDEEFKKEELIKEYEAKLCAMEYDKNAIIQETNHNYKLYNQEISNLNNEISKLKNLLSKSDQQKETINEDYRKLEERYRVSNEYIKVLPTPHESDRLNTNFANLKKSNERYKSQINESQRVIIKLENELSHKTAELCGSNDREVLLKSQLDVLSEKLCNVQLSSKVKVECTENWTSSPDLIEDMRLTLERYKNELVQTRQILESEKKKSERININYQNKLDDLQKQLDSESETIATLRREMDQKHFHCNDLEQKLKSVAYEKQDILGNMMDLQTEIERLDHFGSDFLQQLFTDLLSEVLSCSREIETVAGCLWKLTKKEELDLSELLTSSCIDSLSITVPDSRQLNKQFLEHYLSRVRESRSQLSHIRDSITQLYTNQMATDVKFCVTQ